MPQRAPSVTVVMASFNHGQFVEEAVASVLAQTHQDLELIIVDDGSTDDSRTILRRFSDRRITLVLQENQGPSVALNTGISQARGSSIALMSSDDVCLPHRLQTQLAHLQSARLDAVFSLPQLIDENGRELDDDDYPAFFGKSIASRGQLFRMFFHQGNFLCAPSALIRAEALRAAGPFRPASIQLQDYDMWVRMVKRGSLGLSGDRLVRYRVRGGGENLSGAARTVRVRFELYMIYQSFFEGAGAELLREAFPETVGVDLARSAEDLELDKSFVYLTHGDPLVKLIGAERLFAQFEDDRLARKLTDERGFALRRLHQLGQTIDFQNTAEVRELRAAVRKQPSPHRAGALQP
ncbi:MAG: glycosyltransferase family 2 protein [Myxococcaceae bacterium]